MKKLKVCMLLICLIMCFSTITFAANFYDIKGTAYEGVVNRISGLGIINGISENAFAPNKGITRAELAKMIVYTKGLKDYADTSKLDANFSDTKDHWAEQYIAVANELGLLKGYSDGTFRPDKEVSYAEVVAIVLRILGYVNIDETQGNNWYFGYTKRMYEIGLDKNVPKFASFEAPAKRGDVAIFWWNMLISDRWAITSESDGSGLFYTYSPKTQLQTLFPDFSLVKGRVTSIANGSSGDFIEVTIGKRAYDTNSVVQIYALGANSIGVYDEKEEILYGFSIDEDLVDYKIVSGPIFYLEELGYKLNKSEHSEAYGSMADATYAYLLVSKEDGTILRTVYLDATESYFVKSIQVKNQENEKEYDDSDEEDEDEVKIQDIFMNNDEEPFATSESVIIKNGQKVTWDSLGENVVLTELIPGSLYTYSTQSIEGELTNFDNLKELYVDNDKYLVADNCEYTIFGENDEEDDDKQIIFNYHTKMKKNELEKLLTRNIVFYFNIAEEISMIEFGKYMPSNIAEKYDNEDRKFFYITSISYGSGETAMTIGGKSFSGKTVKINVDSEDEYSIGDLIAISGIEGRTAQNVDKLDVDAMYEEEDIMVIYDCGETYYNEAFGEYVITDETLLYSVNKIYKDNSNSKVETCEINELTNLRVLGDLSKYTIVLLCNTNMEVEMVFAERELNKATYPVGRVVEIKKLVSDDDDDDVNKDFVESVEVKIATIGGRANTYVLLSGDCAVGELVTYDIDEDNEEDLTIKERFKSVFLGYKNDIIIESVDKDTNLAKVANAPEKLDLTAYTYDFNGKEIDLLEYKYLLTNVRQDIVTGEWKFINGVFYEKDKLKLEPGDRIAFGELNGIAVIYRGYK